MYALVKRVMKGFSRQALARPFRNFSEPLGGFGRLQLGISHLLHTCRILPPSEIDLGLFWVVFAGSEGKHLFHRIG